MAGQTTAGILHLFLEGHKLNLESGKQMLPFLIQWDRMGRVLTGRSHQATWWTWKGHHIKLLMSVYAPVPRMSFFGCTEKKRGGHIASWSPKGVSYLLKLYKDVSADSKVMPPNELLF